MSRAVLLVLALFVVAATAEEEDPSRTLGTAVGSAVDAVVGAAAAVPSLAVAALPTVTLPFNILNLPVPGRPGLCPYVRRLVPAGGDFSASVCGNACWNDMMCSTKQKCCPTECGYSCFDAVNFAG